VELLKKLKEINEKLNEISLKLKSGTLSSQDKIKLKKEV
jgi:hypothetical protein